MAADSDKNGLRSKAYDSANNPCLEEYRVALNCGTYTINRADCEQYFENYRQCKKFWHKIILERRQNGIKPEVPDVQEQAEIKARLRQQLQS